MASARPNCVGCRRVPRSHAPTEKAVVISKGTNRPQTTCAKEASSLGTRTKSCHAGQSNAPKNSARTSAAQSAHDGRQEGGFSSLDVFSKAQPAQYHAAPSKKESGSNAAAITSNRTKDPNANESLHERNAMEANDAESAIEASLSATHAAMAAANARVAVTKRLSHTCDNLPSLTREAKLPDPTAPPNTPETAQTRTGSSVIDWPSPEQNTHRSPITTGSDKAHATKAPLARKRDAAPRRRVALSTPSLIDWPFKQHAQHRPQQAS